MTAPAENWLVPDDPQRDRPALVLVGPDTEPPESPADVEPEPGDEFDAACWPDEEAASIDSVALYLRQIRAVPLLTAQQEVDLAKRIEVGVFASEQLDDGHLAERDRADLAELVRDGNQAMRHLLAANLRLVVSIAKRYTSAGMPLLDLIQEGNLGLIRAVQKFDYAKGYKFSTYATWWIRQAITRALADQGRTIRIPVNVVELMNKLNRMQRDLAQTLGHEPSIAELAESFGDTPERVRELLALSVRPVSLDQPLGDGTETTFAQLVAGSLAVNPTAPTSELREQLDALLATLSERDANILRMRSGLLDGNVHSFEQIGRTYGKSRERIRHIESAALRKLRRVPGTEALRDYLTDE